MSSEPTAIPGAVGEISVSDAIRNLGTEKSQSKLLPPVLEPSESYKASCQPAMLVGMLATARKNFNAFITNDTKAVYSERDRAAMGFEEFCNEALSGDKKAKNPAISEITTLMANKYDNVFALVQADEKKLLDSAIKSISLYPEKQEEIINYFAEAAQLQNTAKKFFNDNIGDLATSKPELSDEHKATLEGFQKDSLRLLKQGVELGIFNDKDKRMVRDLEFRGGNPSTLAAATAAMNSYKSGPIQQLIDDTRKTENQKEPKDRLDDAAIKQQIIMMVVKKAEVEQQQNAIKSHSEPTPGTPLLTPVTGFPPKVAAEAIAAAALTIPTQQQRDRSAAVISRPKRAASPPSPIPGGRPG